jgi:segregation and condensation protein B
MSLKPRIEALIYAAEEPVTLGQLTALLAGEAEAFLLETQPDGGEPYPVESLPEESEESPVADASGATLELAMESMESGDEAAEVPAVDAETAAKAAADADKAAEKKAAKEKDRKLREVVRGQVHELIGDYANNERGMEIREVAGGYRMSTKPEYHDTVRSFVKSLKPAMKLSLQALETLAVIAYKQPVTAPEISEIRGVDSSGVLGSLIARKLITTAGRKQVIGRPILYKTTRDFLLRFGLKDISELPSIEEFEKLAGELAEVESEGMTDAAEPELTFGASLEVEAEERDVEAEESDSDVEVKTEDAAAEEGTPVER